MQRRKSFREIARECNVSAATVSRIANGIGSFKEETREQVLSRLLQEGYEIEKKDDTASLKRIALVATDLSNEIFCNIAQHLKEYLMERNCLLSIYVENRNQDYLIREIQNPQLEGLLFLSTPFEPSEYESLLPAVHILSGQGRASYKGQKYTVSSDDYVGGQLAAQELLLQGCRRPLILNSRYMHSSISPRVQGFIKEFADAGIPEDQILIHEGEPSKSSFNSASDAVTYLWTKGDVFDCIFACSDWRAYGALVALRNRKIQVPEEVKLIGYDGILISHYSEHPLTTIQQNPDMLAEAAANTLLTLIEGGCPESDILIPVQIQKGSTV